ncbi:hypothetical protein [Paractinoplanes rishiriensis]|uniref:Uncharacterized protein n=1 Tax=Paractinoplanes rishiriensis TaxID=1050105 RepID=A0A919N0C0_9ACTN|nr:hypothetical protein [Actinoplanes rishiriensis]GIE94912.1 hypothetical protein Ari01nite_23770 [Actinoplanes rishiriensis]
MKPESGKLPWDNHPSKPWEDLPGRVSQAKLEDAIERSGYPFQALVSDQIRQILGSSARIQEEWPFVDRESGQVRSTDIFAQIPLAAEQLRNSALMDKKVRPVLNLLVECKKSELPYVFFMRKTAPSSAYTFPEVAGLPSTDIIFDSVDESGKPIRDDVDCAISLHDSLGFYQFPFFGMPHGFVSVSLAKATEKGGKVELSGEDVYRSLALPLFKAADFVKESVTPTRDQAVFDCHFVVCLAVVRAPMFGALAHDGDFGVTSAPWFRACRIEPKIDLGGVEEGHVRYFDVVHDSFLEQYLSELRHSFESAASRVLRHNEIIASGKGIWRHSEDPATAKDLHECIFPYTEGPERSEDRKEPQYRVRISHSMPRYTYTTSKLETQDP